MAAPLSPGSGIPKPMAAVKGTTKQPQPVCETVPSDAPIKGNSPSVPEIKRDDVYVALVSPMRASINEDDLNRNEVSVELHRGEIYNGSDFSNRRRRRGKTTRGEWMLNL